MKNERALPSIAGGCGVAPVPKWPNGMLTLALDQTSNYKRVTFVSGEGKKKGSLGNIQRHCPGQSDH